MIGRFRIGDLFPADDPIARFVMTLAMHANDMARSVAMFPEPDDSDLESHGRRLMLMRYQAGIVYEVDKFIKAARLIPEVDDFIASLGDAMNLPDTLAGLVDQLTVWLGDLRNVTFHYAEMHPGRIAAGKDEVMNALAEVADHESEIAADDSVAAGATVGFPFADVVVGQWLRRGFLAGDGTEVTVRDAILAASAFSRAAVIAYIVAKGEDAFRSFDETDG
jgi:hypothetical protein